MILVLVLQSAIIRAFAVFLFLGVIMAPTGEEEVEYESDPEEVKRSLAMRRKEASDDEDDEAAREDDDGQGRALRTEIHSDESDGQGGVAKYENEDEEGLVMDGEDGDDISDEDEEYTEEGYVEGDYGMEHVAGRMQGNMMKAVEGDRTNGEEAMKGHAAVHVEEDEEKEKGPFSVPTAGAFYMHDDRFQEKSGGRHRRMHGGRRLWESKDDRKWGHDKFEEMDSPQKQYERRRTSRGRFRGRGWTRGEEHGYNRGSSSKKFSDNGNQNQFSKSVTRGRGPRKYETTLRNGNQASSARNKQSWNSLEKKSHLDLGRAPTATASSDIEAGHSKKDVAVSILNSASPPFYPSGSSNSLAQKDIQVGMGRLHMNESSSPTGRSFGNTKISSSASSSVGTGQTPQSMSQASKGSGQSSLRPSAQPVDQPSAVVRLLASSPPKASSSKSLYASAEMKSASESDALVAKGKGALQPSGSPFLYGRTQVMGPAGSLAMGHGNPNFPAFLPLMQFGGQQGGVPTFGMAFPGYVQPEHGLGNPEMTWLPILAGPGALGATYCPPYADVDGSNQASRPGLYSAGSSSKESSTNKPDNEQKASERPEATNNGILQRQNNSSKQPRRYSEMNFSK